MIVKKQRSYLGLTSINAYVTDTSRTSPDYLRLDSVPTELTAGKNIIKILGNSVFKKGTSIYVEVLDSRGNTVYVDYPNYFDSLKRRIIVIEVTEETAPGPATITICSTLNDSLVPAQYRDSINFKWETKVNIAPFKSNATEIIYTTPPVVELQTRIRPFVTSSYRNGEEMISREYGDYVFTDYEFDDYEGAQDGSSAIHQSNKASKLLSSYTSASITSFDRDNTFYLKSENYSAKHIVRNYPVIYPGSGFYSMFNVDVLQDPDFKLNWTADSHYSKTTYSNRGTVYQKISSTLNEVRIASNIPVTVGDYYLIAVDVLQVPSTSTFTFNAYLGTASGSSVVTTGAHPEDVTVYYIFQAESNAFSFGAAGAGGWYIDNIRVIPFTSINLHDFTMETDLIGGFIKVHSPVISPTIPSGYSITNPDTSYNSYVDFILQNKHVALDNRFSYDVLPTYQLADPTSKNATSHKVNSFTSSPRINYSNLLNTITDDYAAEYSLSDPYGLYQFLKLTQGPGSLIYGVNYGGGINDGGGLYSYDVNSKQFTVLHYFNTSKFAGRYPTSKPLYLNSSTGPVLYGATYLGGKYNTGSLYKYDINSAQLTKIHDFGLTSGSNTYSVNNGTLPGDMIQASNGLLYGITAGPDAGGSYGTMYTFNTASNTHNIVHRTGSYGGNLLENNGYIWYCMPYDYQGRVSKLNISTNVTTSIHSFTGADGTRPLTLMLGSDGNIYGSTYTGSVGSGTGGTIFKINPNTNTFTTLFDLDTSLSGSNIETPFFEDSGYFYGMCDHGGNYNLGTVFRFSTSSNAFEVLHHFSGTPDGQGTRGGFVRIGNSLYGSANLGGAYGNGALFRLDRVGVSRPYVEKESGVIYHHNAIIPRAIPATSSLLIDFPKWTGPVQVSESDLYSIVELYISDLEPITGDVSKIKLSAKPQGLKGEFTDLGIYSTNPADVLLDTNYVNHVHHVESPYRLTGYFKPVISNADTMYAESNSFRTTPFLSGWITGSITNDYFKDSNFHTNISIKNGPESNINQGGIARCILTSNPADNGLAYLIYTASTVPPINSNLDLWEQISYDLYSAAPFPINMDTTTKNWYTSSNGKNILNLNNILVYCGIVNATSSLNSSNIVALSSDLSSIYDITGSSVSQSSGAHPYMFNNKLGWTTETFFVTASIASSQSLYPALFFEYNTMNQTIFGNTISSTRPHLVEISNLSTREIGDRSYMINTYWDGYTRVSVPNNATASIANIQYNTDTLIDSAKLDVYDNVIGISSSRAVAYVNQNRVGFQTADQYKFFKDVSYILSFNAFSRINTLHGVDINVVSGSAFSNAIGSGWTTAGTWTEGSGYKEITFDVASSGYIYATGSSYVSGDYQLKIDTGMFTFSNMDNPIFMSVEWGGITQTTKIFPYSKYSFICNPTSSISKGPKIILSASYTDAAASIYLTDIEIKRYNYDYLTNTALSPILPRSSKLRVYGINSNFGVPFADQLTTIDPGEFIGELEQELQYNHSGETKNFGRVEMEFTAEQTGYGGISFESDLGAEWYISDVSIRTKDRVGLTPTATRLFIKIPNELVNKPLTFKVEYLNDSLEKSAYVTMLNDVIFSNKDEAISKDKGSLINNTVQFSSKDTTHQGPNSSEQALDPGTNITD